MRGGSSSDLEVLRLRLKRKGFVWGGGDGEVEIGGRCSLAEAIVSFSCSRCVLSSFSKLESRFRDCVKVEGFVL